MTEHAPGLHLEFTSCPWLIGRPLLCSSNDLFPRALPVLLGLPVEFVHTRVTKEALLSLRIVALAWTQLKQESNCVSIPNVHIEVRRLHLCSAACLACDQRATITLYLRSAWKARVSMSPMGRQGAVASPSLKAPWVLWMPARWRNCTWAAELRAKLFLPLSLLKHGLNHCSLPDWVPAPFRVFLTFRPNVQIYHRPHPKRWRLHNYT